MLKHEADRAFALDCANDVPGSRDRLVDTFADKIRSTIVFATSKYAKNNLSRVDIEDLVQEIFLSLFEKDGKKLRSFEGKNKSSLANWLRIVAVNYVSNHMRKRFHRDISLDDDYEKNPDKIERRPDHKVLTKELLTFLNSAVEKMTYMNRLIFRLIVLDECSYVEASALTGLKTAALQTRIHRIKKRLKDLAESQDFM